MPQEPIRAVDTIRRRFVFAFPGAAALGSSLSLLACGGGSDPGPAPAPAPGPDGTYVGTHALKPLPVTIALPAGLPAPASGLVVQALLSGFQSVSGTSVTVDVLNDSPQLVTVLSGDGFPLLVGFVHSGHATIDARSTAAAILAFALGVDTTRGAASAAWLAEIEASPVTAQFGDTLGTVLAADPTALVRADARLGDALLRALNQLVPAAMAPASTGLVRTAGVTIDPAGEASYLEPLVGNDFNTLVLRNRGYRRVAAVVRREGHVDAAGTFIPDPARPVVQEFEDGKIPAPPGFENILGIEKALTEWYYGIDASSLVFGTTDPVTLQVAPAGARRVKYSVSAMMAGNSGLGFDTTAYANLRPADRRLIDMDGINPENLTLKQLVIDLLIPLVLASAAATIGKGVDGDNAEQYKLWKDVAKAVIGEVLTLMQSTIPGVLDKLRHQDPDPRYNKYGAGDALEEIVRNHLFDRINTLKVPTPIYGIVEIPQPTPFLLELIRIVLSAVAKNMLLPTTGYQLNAVLNGNAVLANSNNQYKFTTRLGTQYTYNNGTALSASGAFTIFKLMGTVDAVYGLINKARLMVDLARGRVLESWDVWVNAAKVKLTPDPFEVVPGVGNRKTITASIVDNVDDAIGNEAGQITFDWECTGRWGTLFSNGPATEPNTFTSSAVNPTADYFPSGAEPDPANPDTITVTAYAGIKNNPKAMKIGKTQVTVAFKKDFSLMITPATGTDIPAGQAIGVAAFVKESLPFGTTVDWTWSHAGGGTLEARPANTNPAESSAVYTAPSTEGTVTVSAVARINIPAKGSQPPRVVTTDPVRATLNVKQNLRTVTVRGTFMYVAEWGTPFTSFGCGTEANPVGTCVPVNVFFYAAFPKVPGAKSMSMILDKPTRDPLGAITFPFGPTDAVTGRWIDRGGYWLQGLSSVSVTAGENGVQPGASIASETARFADMTITATAVMP